MTVFTRRVFLKSSGVALVSFGIGPSFLARAASAASGRRRTLVAIFQRGAMDGLMAVAPVSDTRLSALRPRIGMSAARTAGDAALIDLGGGFALHPGFEAFVPLYKEGSLAIVHAVGSPDSTRSHFDAQDYMESGTPGVKGTASGWLNRVAGGLEEKSTPWRAVAITPALPRSLYGDVPAIAVTRLDDFRLARGATIAAGTAGGGFEALYAETSQRLLQQAGAETFDAIRLLEEARKHSQPASSSVAYPGGPLSDALRQIAQLVKADVGLEVAFAETGGWDTHVRQGTDQGTFAQRARDLAGAIAAFWADLGPRQEDVALLTMTEFGRTVRENGTGGTDHGHGSCLFVLGHRFRGGTVHGRLPALDPDDLYEGRDLPVTTDFRSVFAQVAMGHLGVAHGAAIFPGWSGGDAKLQLLRDATSGRVSECDPRAPVRCT
jgi:uncharacterized protein (DUF1501 family)